MEIHSTNILVQSSKDVSTILSNQNKLKTSASSLSTNINQLSYNQLLVWNQYALILLGVRL